MGLQAQTAEKLAEGFGSHASFEAEHKERGHKQADEPGAAGLRFPQRRLRGAVPAIHGLEVAMDAAFGKPGAIRQAPDALLAVCTNCVENDNTLGPQSHGVGPCSEGWLQLEKSALQSTRSTAGCPALRGCPCGAGNAQALRHFCRICLTIHHGGHGHAQRCFHHFTWTTAPPSPSPSRCESCSRPLTDQLSFKFGQRCK